MNLILLAVITALVGLTVTSSESTPLSSLCVIGEDRACWIDKSRGEQRELQPGDYCQSPADYNRTLDRLKNVQK